MTKAKIIAMYLPQYHCIPENDNFWGKGFTDWVTVKKAKPLFKGHNQPRVPLNNNYYDLSLEENVVWQAKLAKEHGIYGFGVYHYWFNNEQNLLTKPAETIRDSKYIDINYFLAWDNANWKRSWSNVEGNDWAPVFDNSREKNGPIILVNYILGQEKDWENHFNYLLSHFKNERYIKVDNKPVFIIFNYDEQIAKMCSYWNKLAKIYGFDGMHFVMKKKDNIVIPTDYHVFKYEPVYSGWRKLSLYHRLENRLRKVLGISAREFIYDYDKVWQKLLNNARDDKSSQLYHGAFISYDDTPRRGRRGTIVKSSTPEKFKNYLEELLKISTQQEKEFIFLTAWNEWGEGAFLEPDESHRYEYIKSLTKICK